MLQYMIFYEFWKSTYFKIYVIKFFLNITPRTKAIWVLTHVISSYEDIGRLLLILLLFLIVATTWHHILFKSGFRVFIREIARVIDFYLMEIVIFNDFSAFSLALKNCLIYFAFHTFSRELLWVFQYFNQNLTAKAV